ncbi:tautomerase family protein [Vibrio salinus]|uniref:tautomerase family protein n=1 Tax=Vibrio salinus TaxID=2899784 RepID=UPI001E5F766C|nr:tautomerase family protein [Vibrio salinus]MCE0492690.1 4-oxalocrotonate tautomerase family protein [Vibrio salinus]
MITFESGTLTEQQKRDLTEKLTSISSEITGIPKASFFITLREQPDENIAIGGKSVKAIKKELGLL